MNPISRYLAWLHAAFGLLEPDTPAALDTSRIVPVIDVGQRGWADARWTDDEATKPAGSAAGVINLGPEDFKSFTTIILGFSANSNGGAAGSVDLIIRNPTTGRQIHMANENLSAAGLYRYEAWVTGARPLVIPPGWRAALSHNALGAGISLTVASAFGIARAGYGFTP